jgi:hypothetical protein
VLKAGLGAVAVALCPRAGPALAVPKRIPKSSRSPLLLYYTGDRSRHERYPVDVYTQAGAPVETTAQTSTGRRR